MVLWVLDSNSRYEVSTKEHLLQIMNKGSLYTDTGTVPSNYWTSNYIQTANIDLESDSNITPIGTESISFTGNFDGDEYQISNWRFDNDDKSVTMVGLFGQCEGSLLRNIRLSGTWYTNGYGANAGFMVGNVLIGSNVYNCEGDFSSGTYIGSGSISTNYCAMMIGSIRESIVNGITLKGEINVFNGGDIVVNMGCVIGYLFRCTDVSHLVNMATFPNGITTSGAVVGGVVGNLFDCPDASYMHNAMIGNLTCISTNICYCGGVIALCFFNFSYPAASNTDFINSMTGNLDSTRYTGGVLGSFEGRNFNDPNVLTRMVNYMSGNITGLVNGGLMGQVRAIYNDTVNEIRSSIVAMNGNTTNASLGTTNASEHHINIAEITINTNFGMTYVSNNIVSTATTLSGFSYDSTFTDLPYVNILKSFPDGKSKKWEFVFGNLSGNTTYSDYTHLTIHQGDVSIPYKIDFDILDSNTTKYLTYGNLGDKEMFTNDTLTVLDSKASTVYNYDKSVILFQLPPMTISARSINVMVDILPITGATGYRLTYQKNTESEVIAFSGFIDLRKNLKSLTPDTSYTIRLYVNTGTGYVLSDTVSTTTLSNSSDNYIVEDFLDGNIYDFRDLDSPSKSRLSSEINDILNTGDEILISTEEKKNFIAKFVKRGGSIRADNSLLLPFNETLGDSQGIDLILSDESTLPINYDEIANTIEINSVIHNVGDVIILDGKKCTVLEYE